MSVSSKSDDERVRIQLSFTKQGLDMLDEMCEANGAVSRSNMAEMAVRKIYFADEITQQMRAMRRLPKRGRDGAR